MVGLSCTGQGHKVMFSRQFFAVKDELFSVKLGLLLQTGHIAIPAAACKNSKAEKSTARE